MLTFDDVAGPWKGHADLTPEREHNIRTKLLPAVWRLQVIMREAGVDFLNSPRTGTNVSGHRYGGFRPQMCAVGAPKSNHKEGLAVDLYDPVGAIDNWGMAHLDTLREVGIWLEHPDATIGWSHWQCVPPASGRIVFRP